MFITVDDLWFTKIRTYAGLVSASADQFFGHVDSVIPPTIGDREGILSQFHPMLLLLWRIHFELDKATQCINDVLANLKDASGQPSRLDCMVDELALRQRKLLEALLNLILLSHHADAEHFRHLNLKHQQKELNRQAQNLQMFYGTTSQQLNARIGSVQSRIAAVESAPGFSTASCQYLNAGGAFKSTEQMLVDSIAIASEFEKAALGFSYQGIFGLASKDIHFGDGSHRIAQAEEQKLTSGLEKLLSLAICNILRINSLYVATNGSVTGANSTIETLFRAHVPHAALSALVGNASPGDIVLVLDEPFNRVGEITRTITSATTGYIAYELKILFGAVANSEVVPSTQIVLLVPRSETAAFVQKAIDQKIVDESVISGDPVDQQIMYIFSTPGGNDAFFAAISHHNLDSSMFANASLP